MNKTILISLVGFFALFSANLQAELKILTVDIGKVHSNYERAQKAQKKFGTTVQGAQEEIRTLIEEGRELSNEYQDIVAKANNPALSESARKKFGKEAEQLQKKMRRKETEINNFKQQTDQQLGARRNQMMKLHLDEIRSGIKTIAEKRKADFVFNSNGTGLLYHKEGTDITQAVIDNLNETK